MALDKRQTDINIMDLDKTKYYLFEIGRRIKHRDYIEHKYPSKVFYFGQQGKRLSATSVLCVYYTHNTLLQSSFLLRLQLVPE